MSRSPGQALRTLSSQDLILVREDKRRDQIEKHYVFGHSPEKTARSLGLSADDIREYYAKLETEYADRNNDRFFVKVHKLLKRSEIRSSRFRRVVKQMVKLKMPKAVMSALKSERGEDEYQLKLITNYLISSVPAEDLADKLAPRIEETFIQSLNHSHGDMTERELELTLKVRKSIFAARELDKGVEADYSVEEDDEE